MDELDIVLPVYNERDTLPRVLAEWAQVLSVSKIPYHFVICEDGSTDGTKESLQELIHQYPIILSQRDTRRGYGGAVIDGIHAASSRFVLCIDSDGQCDPQDLPAFWTARDTADILIGWRTRRSDTWMRKVFSRMFHMAFQLLFPIPIHDPSAPFVLFKKETIIRYVHLLRYLKEGFWWGFIGMCVKVGLSVRELPINHRLRMQGKTQVYHLQKIPGIAVRNLLGLIALYRA